MATSTLTSSSTGSTPLHANGASAEPRQTVDPRLNTSMPNYQHSEVSVLDDMQSVAPGSSVSMQDEDQERVLSNPDNRVPFNQQQHPIGLSPLRFTEIGAQHNGALSADGAGMSKEQRQPMTVQQQPQPTPPPLHDVGARYQYKVPPGENPEEFVIPLQTLKVASAPVDCPRCHERSMTRIEKVSGTTVSVWAVVLCCFTGLLCAWVPCVMDGCKDTEHYCGNCNSRLATVTNGGSVQVHTASVAVRSQYAPQPSKEETKELSATDTKVMGTEAYGIPVSEMDVPTVRNVGGPPQEMA